MNCKWDGKDRPRIIGGRHNESCADDQCRGCQPCTEPHCRVCGTTHATGTCAECLATARATLHSIAQHCDALPDEVAHRGIDGEAMMLLGPAANPEARGHLEASIAAGRVPPDYLDRADHELHPLFILGCWDMVWRDALEHDETESMDLPGVIDYLDRQMTYMAGYEHVAFEEFADDLRRCETHIRAVLHDQNQGDRANIGCFECGADIERRLGDDGFEDFWTCTRCRRRYTVAEYNFALRAALETAEETA